MGRKAVLEARKRRLEERKASLIKRSDASDSVEEVRSINEQLKTITEDLEDVIAELKALDEDGADNAGKGDTGETGTGEEARQGVPANAEVRGLVRASFKKAGEERNTNILDSLEYRNAFANYVRTGSKEAVEKIEELEQRAAADGMVLTSDVGKVIPNTIMQEFIKKVSAYGQLYALVRKLSVKGGVEFPISELVPEVRWISETKVSDNQSAPEINASVSFSYHVAEARISQSLLSSIVTLDVLEKEIATLITEAFVKEMEKMIVSGTGVKQPLGILNDKRVKEENKLDFSVEEMADWKTWRKKLFAAIPLAYRGQGILIMTAGTWESNIMTLKDDNNNPIYKETYDAQTGEMKCRFNGREVVLVEPDILKDYEAAEVGEAFAIYLKPTNYAINTQYEVRFKRYYDEDNNRWVNKGLLICDGKLLDTEGVFILRKGEETVG